VDEIVTRMQQAIGHDCHVLATGGLAGLVASESRTIREVTPNLTLDGLALVYQLNHPS
jgi:type III pantothenate kinase